MPLIGAWHGMQLKDLFVVLFLLQGIQEFILGVFRLCTLHGTKISHLAKRNIIFKSALVGDTECEYLFVRTLPPKYIADGFLLVASCDLSAFQLSNHLLLFAWKRNFCFLGRGFQTPGAHPQCHDKIWLLNGS